MSQKEFKIVCVKEINGGSHGSRVKVGEVFTITEYEYSYNKNTDRNKSFLRLDVGNGKGLYAISYFEKIEEYRDKKIKKILE